MLLLMRLVVILSLGWGLMGLSPAWATPQDTEQQVDQAQASVSLNRIQRLQILPGKTAKQLQIVLHGSRRVQFSTFVLQNPQRLIVDLRSATVKDLRGPWRATQGPFQEIEVHQYSHTDHHIGRLVIHLRAGARWQIKKREHRLVISLTGDATPKELSRQQTPKLKNPHARFANRLVHQTGRLQGSLGRKATRLMGIQRQGKKGLVLQFDGAVPNYEVIELQNPPRLVVDLYEMRRGLRPRVLGCRFVPVRSLRTGRHAGKLRVVLDGCKGLRIPPYKVELGSRSLRIRFLKVALRPTVRHLTNVGLSETAKETTLRFSFQEQPASRIKREGRMLVLDLLQTKMEKSAQSTLDTSAFAGALQQIHIYPYKTGVRVVVQLRALVADRLHWENGLLLWQFAMPKEQQKTAKREKKDANYRITYHPQQVGQASGGSLPPEMIATLAQRSERKRYRGHRISMYFRKVEIHNLLRLFSEISGLNIITSESVSGRLTLKLRNVPWDQALDVVLKTLKLGMEREGNIIRIATLQELKQEHDDRRKLLEAKLLEQPQKIRLIPVNYAQANEMATQVQAVLSPRGKVTVDNRTNVLIVKDYVPFLIRSEGLVRSLDTQTPQVLIETRIVEANINFDQQFGIQWGGHLLFSPMTGNSTGLAFPNPFGVRGGVPDAAAGGGGGGGQATQGEGVFGTPNYIVNFPATVGRGRGTALSFLFGTLTGAASLQLRLSAAESTGKVKIISAPKIVTLHKMSANIQQGVQIPFTSASAAGTNTQFIAATLSLSVTPQVTTDGSVFLQLNVTNNAPDFSKGGAAGPAITTKTAQTNMLIKDGETMVIGGIYSRRTGFSENRVPFLGSIPILGWLFKNYTFNDDRAELLVFVTPRIINRAQTLGGRQGS